MSAEPKPELVEEVAAQFEQLQPPLNPQWMAARKVSLEDVEALSQRIALVLRGYLALPPKDRIAFVSQGIFSRQKADKPAETPVAKRPDIARKKAKR